MIFPELTFGEREALGRLVETFAEAEEVLAAKLKMKTITEDHRKKKEGLTEQLTDSLSNILLGEKIPLDVVNAQTGEIIIPANRKITKTLLRKLANVYDHIEIDPSPTRNKIRAIFESYEPAFIQLELSREQAIDAIRLSPLPERELVAIRQSVALRIAEYLLNIVRQRPPPG